MWRLRLLQIPVRALTIVLAILSGLVCGFVVTVGFLERAHSSNSAVTEHASFKDEIGRASHLRDGWYQAERWGTWSKGPRAEIEWPLKRRPASDLVVTIEGRIFPYDAAYPQTIVVLVNDTRVAVLKRNYEGELYGGNFRIPNNVAITRTPLRIVFEISNPTAPSAISNSTDHRLLGLGLAMIELNYSGD